MATPRPYGEDGATPKACAICSSQFNPGKRIFWNHTKKEYWCYECTFGITQPVDPPKRKK